MAKTDAPSTTPTDAVISIVGTGMTIVGDSETDGSLRIEGTVRGDVRAGKSVVIAKDALLEGSVYTQDALIAGRVLGAVYVESYLELQATSEISGDIHARRVHVEDGCAIQGRVTVRPDVDHSTKFERVLWSTLSLCRVASGRMEQPEGEGGAIAGAVLGAKTSRQALSIQIDGHPPSFGGGRLLATGEPTPRGQSSFPTSDESELDLPGSGISESGDDLFRTNPRMVGLE